MGCKACLIKGLKDLGGGKRGCMICETVVSDREIVEVRRHNIFGSDEEGAAEIASVTLCESNLHKNGDGWWTLTDLLSPNNLSEKQL